VILVLVEGRPRVIRDIVPDAKAILLACVPGSGGGPAIANVLFGDANPSGKLPFTYPRYANHLITYDRKTTARLDEDMPIEGKPPVEFTPQFEFGTGLSYTTFQYSGLALDHPVLTPGQHVTVSVTVANTGQRVGREVVELYSHQLYASLTPPLKRLRGFQSVQLPPGQSAIVKFEITAADLAFVNAASKLVTEPGDYELMIAGQKVPLRIEQ